MPERLHALVHGDVQGVGFRDFVRRRADEFGLGGWVANRPDGSVECVADGDRARLEAFLERLRQGPRLAEVEHVDANWQAVDAPLQDFEVRF